MEKGEIAHFEQFHLFPQCFPEVFFFSVLKQVYMEESVKRRSRPLYDNESKCSFQQIPEELR